MQQLSFQINQAVLVQSNTPYRYDLAKILARTRNEDEANQYSIRFYKQAGDSRRQLIQGFKIRKISLKLFYDLKEKSQQFPELAKALKSVQSQLRKDEVFIEKEKEDQSWKKLFRNCVLYLQAKRSLRIKYQSISKYRKIKIEEAKSNAKHFQQDKNSISVIVKVSLGKKKRKPNTGNSEKNLKKIKKRKQSKQCSLKKHQTTQESSDKISIQTDKSEVKRNYQSLYQFGLNYIEYTKKLQIIEQQFKQDPAEIFKISMQEAKCIEELNNDLDQFKNMLFSAQFDDKEYISRIQPIKTSLMLKLNVFLHLEVAQFPQSIIQKIGFVIKVYCLKQIDSLKMIIGILKLWLGLFLEKMKKKEQKSRQFSLKIQKAKTLYQEVANLAILE